MVPVRITLVANWRGMGSSKVANIELVDENGDMADGGSSMGPSSTSSTTSAVSSTADTRSLSGRSGVKAETEG
ncbi:hypothetical protein Bca4012_019205 [Brassica carinata]